ncbi:BON domain-containing protein [Actinoplanes sp. NPDC051411]|uniref:BON domain-containing protein n=1 Tax=Actinoplanes sp. NPDC051411 TaxID=3155522 RepID=UPI003428847A
MPQWLVRDVMTSEVVTATVDTPIGDVADLLASHRISAVPRPMARPDAAIRDDVIEHVRRVLWIDPVQVQVHVHGGVVTLTGAVGRRSTAAIAARLAGEVPGAVTVVDRIRYDFDDSSLTRSRVGRTHPFSADPFGPRRPAGSAV